MPLVVWKNWRQRVAFGFRLLQHNRLQNWTLLLSVFHDQCTRDENVKSSSAGQKSRLDWSFCCFKCSAHLGSEVYEPQHHTFPDSKMCTLIDFHFISKYRRELCSMLFTRRDQSKVLPLESLWKSLNRKGIILDRAKEKQLPSTSNFSYRGDCQTHLSI